MHRKIQGHFRKYIFLYSSCSIFFYIALSYLPKMTFILNGILHMPTSVTLDNKATVLCKLGIRHWTVGPQSGRPLTVDPRTYLSFPKRERLGPKINGPQSLSVFSKKGNTWAQDSWAPEPNCSPQQKSRFSRI